MISVKAIAVLALDAAGGFAGATAVYLATHPGVFIGRTEGHVATLLKVAPRRAAVRVVPAPAHLVKLEPVMITTELGHENEHAAASMIDDHGNTASNDVPCSGWRELAAGPEGHRARMLCPH